MSKTDKLAIAMQDNVIRLAEERLAKPLDNELKRKVRLNRWSYMGLEMIIDTVRTIELSDLERYLRNLDNEA